MDSAGKKLAASELKNAPPLKAADEIGEGLSLDISESIVASKPVADNTDVGDWFSCSEEERLGDAELDGFSSAEITFLMGETCLRGYGCIGFLLGLGGGISIGFTEQASPLLDSRTT